MILTMKIKSANLFFVTTPKFPRYELEVEFDNGKSFVQPVWESEWGIEQLQRYCGIEVLPEEFFSEEVLWKAKEGCQWLINQEVYLKTSQKNRQYLAFYDYEKNFSYDQRTQELSDNNRT